MDVTGFGSGVWGLCEQLRRYDVPFVVLSAANGSAIGDSSLSRGAVGVLQKPVAKAALLELVRNLAKRME